MIDLAAFIPTIVRLASGVETPSTARNPFSHYVLVCFVPVIRQLKLIRRFQKLQLLLHHGRLCSDPVGASPLQLAVPSILLLTVLLNFEARVDHGFRCPEAVAVLGLSDCGLAAVATRGEIS